MTGMMTGMITRIRRLSPLLAPLVLLSLTVAGVGAVIEAFTCPQVGVGSAVALWAGYLFYVVGARVDDRR